MKVIKESKTPTEVLATFRLFNNDYEVKGYRQHNPTNHKEIVEIYENKYDYVGKGIETWYNRPWQRFTFANALVKAVVHVFGIQADELIEECVETSRDCQEAMDKFVDGWGKGSVTESVEEDNEKMTCPKCKNNTYQEIEHNSITGQRNFRCASCGYTKSTPEDEEPTNEGVSTVKKPYKVTLKVNSAIYSSFIVKANNEEEAREIAETKSDGKEIIAVKEISDNEVASLKDRGMSVVESVIKEDWVLINFTSGSNPYIAKTEQELARLQKKYGNKMSKQDDTHYIVDDRETNTFTDDTDGEEYIGPISFENGEVLYVVKDGNKLYAGSATNSGVFHDYEMDYDDTFSKDVNLQNFYDKICEENPDLCSDGETNESLKENKNLSTTNVTKKLTESKITRKSNKSQLNDLPNNTTKIKW